MKNKCFSVISALVIFAILAAIVVIFCGCDETVTPASYGSQSDRINTEQAANILQYNQPTPTDIDYSLERYNLIRRAYWVNGQREKANMLVCEIEKPLGYIVLFTDAGGIVGRFVVDGKVSSLNSYLTPDSEYYSRGEAKVDWLADIDGSYGENDSGIFFFTVDGKYIEWTGTYLYSDIPFEVDAPTVLYTEGAENE